MVKPIAKWIMKRYAKLWKVFTNKEFSFEAAIKASEEEDFRIIGIVLSELKRAGWLTVKQDPSNPRKRLYKLKEPNKVIIEIL